MTDITGYSLLGHGYEMAALSGVTLEIDFGAIRLLPGAQAYAAEWIFPGGMANNKTHYSQWVTFDSTVTEEQQALLFDPETSGGLLIAVPAEKAEMLLADLQQAGDVAQRIGRVLDGDAHIHVRG